MISPPIAAIGAHSYMAILVGGGFLKSLPIAAHCSPLLHGDFSQESNSSKVLTLQPIVAHSYKAISVRGLTPEKSSHCIPFQPSYMAVSTRAVIPEKFSHCSSLQPTLTWQFQLGGNSWKSSHCSPLQPTLTWQFWSGGVTHQKTSHCSPLQPTHTWQLQSGG